jgi:hypothetical protein
LSQRVRPTARRANLIVRCWLCGLVIIGLLSAPPAVFADDGQGAAGEVIHVVLIWLKDPGNPQHRQQIVAAAREFQQIPGVIEVRVGESLASERDVVDDSFDVGMFMSFASVGDMNSYLASPAHVQAVQNKLAPLADHYLVYDFVDFRE